MHEGNNEQENNKLLRNIPMQEIMQEKMFQICKSKEGRRKLRVAAIEVVAANIISPVKINAHSYWIKFYWIINQSTSKFVFDQARKFTTYSDCAVSQYHEKLFLL